MLVFLTLINGRTIDVTLNGTVTNSCGNPVPDGTIVIKTNKIGSVNGNDSILTVNGPIQIINGKYSYSRKLITRGYNLWFNITEKNNNQLIQRNGQRVCDTTTVLTNNLSLNFCVVPTTLSGTIEDINSKTPVKNWKITLADTLFTTTDSTGKYIFNLNLNPGFYTFNFKVLDINDSVKTRNLPEIGTTTISNSNCSFGNINFSINSTILYNAPKINVQVQDSSSNTITNRVVILNDFIFVKNGSYTYPTLKIGTYTFKVSIDTIIKDAQVFYNNVPINNSISGDTLKFTTPINSINDSIDVFIVIPDKKKDTTSVGINTLTTPTNKVFINSNVLNITTVKPSNVSVYNLSGQVIFTGIVNGNVLIDLTSKGLYIVKVDKDVIKINKE